MGEGHPKEDRHQNGPEEEGALAVGGIRPPVLHDDPNSPLSSWGEKGGKEENGHSPDHKDVVPQAEEGNVRRVVNVQLQLRFFAIFYWAIGFDFGKKVDPLPLHQFLVVN